MAAIVSDLQVWRENHPEYLKHISNIDGLIESLWYLDSLVEMDAAKETVVKQIKYLIIDSTRADRHFDGNMLNAIITGSPGVGKTELAKRLARVWNSMGLIKKSEIETEPDNLTCIVSNAIHAEYIENLSTELQTIKSNLVGTQDKLSQAISEQHQLFDSLCQLQLSGKLKNSRSTNSIICRVEKVNKTLNELASQYGDLKRRRSSFHGESSSNFDDMKDLIKVVNRDDFTANFVGQTENKTRALLESCRGKVMVIDEAYSLYSPGNGNDDPFGEIALTILNEFMSAHPEEIIVVFAGYKDKMDQTIFKKQPGLRRRCMWNFDIEGYTGEGLTRIFRSQLQHHHFSVDPDYDLEKFFDQNLADFTSFGGDTEKLAYYSALAYSEIKYEAIMNDTTTQNDSILNGEMVERAHKMFIENIGLVDESKENKAHMSMYV